MSVVLGDLADWVVEERDSDGEFYANEQLGEMIVDMLIERGYLRTCGECEERYGWRVVYTIDCPNDHSCQCGECDCLECHPDGCECDPDDCVTAGQRRDGAPAGENDYVESCTCAHCVEQRGKKVEAAWGI